MKIPSSKSNSCAIDRYVGTGFDAVEVVADNIEAIEDIAVAADGLAEIVNNLDDLVKLADSLEEFQVTEQFSLASNQTVVTFTDITTTALEVFIHGQLVDKGRLLAGKDYVVESPTTIRLKRTYPENTILLGIQILVADTTPSMIYSDKTVFNREVIPLAEGAVLKDTVMWGVTLPPLVIYNRTQYYPQSPLPVEHVVTNDPIIGRSSDLGHIQAMTDRGPIIFCALDAMALPRVEIVEMVRQAVEDILSTPPHDWKPNFNITSPSYQIMVDGLSYLPKKIPFTTANAWQDDIANWYLVAGREPKEIEVTGSTLDLTGVDYAAILKAENPVNVVSVRGNNKFRKLLFLTENTNITFVNSPSIGMCTGTTTLSPSCAYEFYSDHNGMLRQLD